MVYLFRTLQIVQRPRKFFASIMSDLEDDLGLGVGSDEEQEQDVNPLDELKSNDDIGVDNDEVEENEDESNAEEELIEQKVLDVSIPRHAVSEIPELATYTLKLPVFLNVDAHPFDPADFKDNIEYNAKQRNKDIPDSKTIKDDLIREKLVNENTIRWKYVNENDEIIKQSNCHFVEWDDGSISLKLGDEMFDFKQVPVIDQILVKSHDELEVLQGSHVITNQVNLLPTSMKTSTHQQLANAIKNTQKKSKILNTITESDPLEQKRLADENDRKIMKMKRQMELKRRLQEERVGSGTSHDIEEGDEPRRYGRFEDEYDEEDDFIDDDDGDEEGAERLRNVKRQGASKYEDDGDDDEEREEEEEAEEAVADLEDNQDKNGHLQTPDQEESIRKRRRIIDSDDE